MNTKKQFNRLILAFSLAVIPTLSMAAPVTITDNNIVYEADDADISAGASITDYTGPSGAAVNIPATIVMAGNTYNVTAIENFAFEDLYGRVRIDSVTFEIPSNITQIGSNAFVYNNLTHITIPDSIRGNGLGINSFSNNNLQSVTLPANLTSIPVLAFASNDLQSITLPDRLMVIDDVSFYNNNLQSITIPPNVNYIGSSAFRNNDIRSVTIPARVRYIEPSAFSGNPNLTEVWFEGDAPTYFTAAGADGSFGEAAGKILYYNCATATGFSTPIWQGYTMACSSAPPVTIDTKVQAIPSIGLIGLFSMILMLLGIVRRRF